MLTGSPDMEATLHIDASRDRRWNRLRHLPANLRPGQVVTLGAVVARTGLEVESVDTVLQALTEARLLVQHDRTTFIRESLWKA